MKADMRTTLPLLQRPERQYIIDLVLDARTLPEIENAWQELRQWLRLHPEDVGIQEGFESLSLMRDIAQEQQAERLAVLPRETQAA